MLNDRKERHKVKILLEKYVGIRKTESESISENRSECRTGLL